MVFSICFCFNRISYMNHQQPRWIKKLAGKKNSPNPFNQSRDLSMKDLPKVYRFQPSSWLHIDTEQRIDGNHLKQACLSQLGVFPQILIPASCVRKLIVYIWTPTRPPDPQVLYKPDYCSYGSFSFQSSGKELLVGPQPPQAALSVANHPHHPQLHVRPHYSQRHQPASRAGP